VPTLVVSALSTFDNKGLKKGKKEVSAFEKQIKSFGKVFAGVFSATALLNYSKNAVKAFMADEKAAKALELQLKNTGFAFAAPSVEYYIANLQKTTGVLDDQLRPAFQQLLTVTGSVTQSQDALATALNISAATGKSVQEVSSALTRAYSGNTTGLSRLGAGISKATLKTGNMEKIMAELNQKFAGQSAARLDTYAGKMDILKVSAENASEIIGKGLLDSLQVLAKDNSIENAGSAMEDLATDIANATYGMALLIAKTKEFLNLPGTSKNLGGPLSFIPIVGPLLESAAKYGATESAKPKSNFSYSLGASATKDIERANKLLKEKNKLEADAIAKLKAKSEVDKLKDKFDVERIGLTLALNQATDEETKLRLRAQLAILDNNEALAKKYNAELGAVAAANVLATSATTAAGALNFLASGMPALFNSLGELTGRGRNQIAPDEFARLPQGVTNMGAQTAATAAATAQTTATLTLDPNASGDKLINAIGELVLVNLKYGNKLVPAGTIL
jgi:hypothetical protein